MVPRTKSWAPCGVQTEKNCSPKRTLFWTADLSPSRPPWCSHYHSVQEQRGEVRLFQLSWHNTSVRLRQNPHKGTTKSTGTRDSRSSPSRDTVWLQSQPGNHRHGICPEADSGEVPGTKQSTVRYLRGSDKGIRYREQVGTLENFGKARLPTKVPHYDHPASRRPAWTSQT